MGTHHSVGTPGLGNVHTKTVSTNPSGCFKYSKTQKSELQICSTCRSVLCTCVMRALGSRSAAVVPNWNCQVWGEGWGWTAEEHRERKNVGSALQGFGVCRKAHSWLVPGAWAPLEQVSCLSTPLRALLVSRSPKAEERERAGAESAAPALFCRLLHKFRRG